MKGARAEVCAKTSSAPSTSSTRMIGSSHSFLFCRRNIHTSPARESLPIRSISLKKSLELLALLPRAFALDPVALLRGAAAAQGVAAGEAREDAVGREDAVVHERQQHA